MLCLQEERKPYQEVRKPYSAVTHFVQRKAPKLKAFIQSCMEKGIVRPVDMKAEYEALYPIAKKKTLEAYSFHCKNLGFTKDVRDQKAIGVARREAQKHILDYAEVNKYVLAAGESRIQEGRIDDVKEDLTKIWNMLGRTDPHTWDYSTLLRMLNERFPKVVDCRGRVTRTKPAAALKLLCAVNTVFPGILPKGFGSGLVREAGELKDYFTFAEFDLFCDNLMDTCSLGVEGWLALFTAQVNMGCREGTQITADKSRTRNGILSLQWEDIDYSQRRCNLHEKGGRGKASRVWQNLPLDLFPWIHGWDALMLYHQKWYRYVPTNERHETGSAFPVLYKEYLRQFHDIRRRCNGRISGDKETLKPHIFRKTHGQWLVKLWIPIEQICGLFPDGYFGVGWDNPKILLKYYVTLEDEQRFKAERQAAERMRALNLL